MYTVTKQEVSDIHNGICGLYSLMQRVDGVIHPDLVEGLDKAFKLIEKGFAGLREQENKEFDSKMDFFDMVKKDNGFNSVWSMFDIDMSEGFRSRSGYTAKELVYEGWDRTVKIQLPDNPTYLQLWAAADNVLKFANDDHHIFIEGFRQSEDGTTLRLLTGS